MTAPNAVIRVNCAGIGAKEIEQRIFNHHGEAKRDQQEISILAVRCRPDDKALQHVADRKKERRKQKRRQVRIEAKKHEGKKRGEHCRGQ